MPVPYPSYTIVIYRLCQRLGYLTVNHFNGLSRIPKEDVVLLCTQLGCDSLRESEGVVRSLVGVFVLGVLLKKSYHGSKHKHYSNIRIPKKFCNIK